MTQEQFNALQPGDIVKPTWLGRVAMARVIESKGGWTETQWNLLGGGKAIFPFNWRKVGSHKKEQCET
jgi:hypothetical protein